MTDFDSKALFAGEKGGAEQAGAVSSREADGPLELAGEHREPESPDASTVEDCGDPSDIPPVEAAASPTARRWGLRVPFVAWTLGLYELAFAAVVLAALGLRLFELSGRTMHYDEAIHLHYAWRLANSASSLLGWPWIFGTDYVHSAWMHGPFQIEMTAVILQIFGDTDFTARLGYALFGTALVALPYFLRDHIGRQGAILAAVMLALSPVLLYFSRFGRNDIIMMFWAVALFTLMWRYLHGGRRLNLYVASAILALMFASKETAYLLVAIFGFIAFVAALPYVLPWLRRSESLAREGTPVAVFLLLFTLTLPQWSALIGMFQGLLGLTLANPDPLTGNNVANFDGSAGMTGAPAWQGSVLPIPVVDMPWILHAAVAVAGLVILFWLVSRGPLNHGRVAGLVGAPLMSAFAFAWILFRPYSGVDPESLALLAADWVIFCIALAVAVSFLFWSRFPIGRAALLVVLPAIAITIYSLLFTPVLNVPGLVDAILPSGVSPGETDMGVPVNYVVAAATLLLALAGSAALGIWWLGRHWLICAAIFYIIWTALYTTMFTNLSGIFTGFWQGMGYWIAQQDVARGNQPWYYYFVGMSVYEILPLVFGVAGIVYFFRRRDVLGLALALWAVLSLAAYTVATEKMPWLVVNITTPFVLVAAKYLGEMLERLEWPSMLARQGRALNGAPPPAGSNWTRGGTGGPTEIGTLVVFVVTPVIALIAVYLFLQLVDPARPFALEHWLLAASALAASFVAALIFRMAGKERAAPAAVLGLAALLLIFGAVGAFRAAYTYDDTNIEIMAYAQGSADIKETYLTLEQEVYPLAEGVRPVKVDYDVWYPLQWYVRDHATDGRLNFQCFELTSEERPGCVVLPESLQEDGTFTFGNAAALVVKDGHVGNDAAVREQYRRQGPFKELLWFPESYRRPDENREEEPMHSQLAKDFGFFRDSVSSREKWAEALNYVIFRELDTPWYRSEYYAYLP